jgi:uncharacterized domain 1
VTSSGQFVHVPDPDNPGWYTWDLDNDTLFNRKALGRLIVRTEGERSARVRMIDVESKHSNLHGNVHGGATLGLIDVAMFATIFTVLGADAAGSVTLDLHTQFIGAGKTGEPLDVVSEVMKDTRRLVFVRGTVEQGDHLVASFVGTLRKPTVR